MLIMAVSSRAKLIDHRLQSKKERKKTLRVAGHWCGYPHTVGKRKVKGGSGRMKQAVENAVENFQDVVEDK